MAFPPPFFLQFDNEYMGDYETIIPSLYKITNYLELYILGAYGDGREQVQVIIKYDSGLRSGIKYRTYENIIKERIQNLGTGKFDILLDDTHYGHCISDYVINKLF